METKQRKTPPFKSLPSCTPKPKPGDNPETQQKRHISLIQGSDRVLIVVVKNPVQSAAGTAVTFEFLSPFCDLLEIIAHVHFWNG